METPPYEPGEVWITIGSTPRTGCQHHFYGLAAAGQEGVAHVLRIFAEEMTRTMMLLGVSSIKELQDNGPSLVRNRHAAFARSTNASTGPRTATPKRKSSS